MLPHFRQRVNESPRQDENFGTFGLFFIMFRFRLKSRQIFPMYFEALFINSANALLLTAVTMEMTAMALDFMHKIALKLLALRVHTPPFN